MWGEKWTMGEAMYITKEGFFWSFQMTILDTLINCFDFMNKERCLRSIMCLMAPFCSVSDMMTTHLNVAVKETYFWLFLLSLFCLSLVVGIANESLCSRKTVWHSLQLAVQWIFYCIHFDLPMQEILRCINDGFPSREEFWGRLLVSTEKRTVSKVIVFSVVLTNRNYLREDNTNKVDSFWKTRSIMMSSAFLNQNGCFLVNRDYLENILQFVLGLFQAITLDTEDTWSLWISLSSPGSPPSEMCLENLQKEAPSGTLIRR